MNQVYAVFRKTEFGSVLMTLFSGSKAQQRASEHAVLKLKFLINSLYGEWDMYYSEFNDYITTSKTLEKEKLYNINKEILEWSNADDIGDSICKDYADFDLFCKELAQCAFPVKLFSVIDTDRMSEV